MQTIHLQVQDNLYNQLIPNGVDIQERFNEFLYNIWWWLSVNINRESKKSQRCCWDIEVGLEFIHLLMHNISMNSKII